MAIEDAYAEEAEYPNTVELTPDAELLFPITVHPELAEFALYPTASELAYAVASCPNCSEVELPPGQL